MLENADQQLLVPYPLLLSAGLQDKAAFAKFQANVRDLAAKNAKNQGFSALNTYSDLSWADVRSRILIKVSPKKMMAVLKE